MVGFFFSWFVDSCRWLGPISCFLMRWRGRGNRKASAVWGNRSHVRNQGCCKRRVREAYSGTHKTSSALISDTYLVGIFLVFGACQVEVWERCLVKWNWSRTIKGIFFQGSVSEAQIFGHMLKNMCFLNTLGDWGCKDCGMNLLWSITW